MNSYPIHIRAWFDNEHNARSLFLDYPGSEMIGPLCVEFVEVFNHKEGLTPTSLLSSYEGVEDFSAHRIKRETITNNWEAGL